MKKINLGSPKEKELKSELIRFDFSELRNISYSNASTDGDFFISFLERLKKLSSLTWQEVYKAHRHSFGTETISVKNLKNSAKNHIPNEITKLLIFRSTGSNKAFLGIREENVFKIFFIEYVFGDIYPHGKKK